MQATITAFIEHDGSVTFLDSELTRGFNLGPSVTRRYSAVEPDCWYLRLVFRVLRCLFGDKGRVAGLTRGWKCLWRADMRPSGSSILPERYAVRQDAIDAEIAYFNEWGVQ